VFGVKKIKTIQQWQQNETRPIIGVL
jgi:hypothetical protein